MADANPQLIQQITASLEATYQALKQAAGTVNGLLNLGRATCDEVQAYNVWALATYHAQQGMLDTLRNAGDDVPAMPSYPTLFAWAGVEGANALNIDCSGQASALSGNFKKTIKRALSGPTAATRFLDSSQVRVITTNQWAYAPEQAGPTWAQLQAKQLGNPILIIIAIAGLSIGVAYGIAALADYLKESDIQAETTERTRVQVDAFTRFTSARLACYSSCTAAGKAPDECSEACARTIPPPDIKIDSARGVSGWGFFQWVGVIGVVAGGAIVLYKIHEGGARSLIPSSLHPHLP